MPADLSICQAAIDRDPILYLDLTEAVRRGDGHVVDACPTGALVAFKDDTPAGQNLGFTLFSNDVETAERLCAQLPPHSELITVHEALTLPILERKFGAKAGHACTQYAYLGPSPLPLPHLSLDVRPLEPAHLADVCEHYCLGSPGYMEWLIAHGRLYGAFEKNTLTGFIGIHAEGSMGLLEVFPAYRRRGVAILLQSWLTNLELSRGHVPYGQVFTHNTASMALQHRLGFSPSKGLLYWVTKK